MIYTGFCESDEITPPYSSNYTLYIINYELLLISAASAKSARKNLQGGIPVFVNLADNRDYSMTVRVIIFLCTYFTTTVIIIPVHLRHLRDMISHADFTDAADIAMDDIIRVNLCYPWDMISHADFADFADIAMERVRGQVTGPTSR